MERVEENKLGRQSSRPASWVRQLVPERPQAWVNRWALYLVNVVYHWALYLVNVVNRLGMGGSTVGQVVEPGATPLTPLFFCCMQPTFHLPPQPPLWLIPVHHPPPFPAPGWLRRG